jgi:phage-related protein/SLT domain-containing protein/BMFP domain-containing protein YqiC
MATITSLGFSIFSRYDGSGVTRARRDLHDLTTGYLGANRSVREFAGASGVLRTAMLGLAPALLPIAESSGAIAAGMAAMTVAAGAAVAAYAAVGVQAGKMAMLRSAEGKALTAHEQAYVKAYNNMLTTWYKFVAGTGQKTLAPQTEAIKGLTSGITMLGPVIDALHPKIMKVATAFREWMQEGGFERFRDGVIKYGVPAFDRLQQAGRNALAALGIGYRTFLPMSDELSKSILKASEAFRNWAEGGGFQRFLERAREHMPEVNRLLQALWALVMKLVDVMRALAPYSIKAATALAEFVAAIPTGVLAGLIGGFILLRTAVATLLTPLAMFRLLIGPSGIFGVLGRILPILVRLGGILGAFITVVTLAWQHSGFFRDAVRGLWDALKGLWDAFQPLIAQLQIFWDKLEPVRAVLGQVFGFILGVAVHAITLFVQMLTNLVIGITAMWAAFNNFLSAIPGAWDAAWNWIKNTANTVWTWLQEKWIGFVTALGNAWNTVSTSLSNTWNTVWTAISTRAQEIWGQLKVLWDTIVNGLKIAWDTVSSALVTAWNTVWNGIKVAAEAVWNWIRDTWNTITGGLSTAWNTVSSALVLAWNTAWNAVKTAAEAVWNWIRDTWNTITNGVKSAWDTVGNALSTAWTTVWNAIKTAAEAVWNWIRDTWNTITNGVKSAWDTVSSALQSAWTTVWNAIKTAAEAVWNWIRDTWNTIINGVKSLWDTVSSALQSAWTTTWNAIKTVAETVWNALKTAWQTFWDAVTTIWNTFRTAISTAWSAFWELVKNVANTVWNALKTAWQTFWEGITQIWNTFRTAISEAWSAFWNLIKNVANTIWNWLKDTWKSFLDKIRELWGDAQKWIKEKWEDAWNWLKDKAKSIWNSIGGIIEKAVNGIITVINGLIGGFNNIAKFLQIDASISPIDPVSFPKFADGGVVTYAFGGVTGGPTDLRGGGALRGYAPGRDTVPAMLSKGEGVLTPEAVRGMGGPGFVHAANKQFAGHRGAGKQARSPLSSYGFARGGMVGGVQHFAVGGITAAALAKAGVPLSLVSQGEHSDGKLSGGTHLGGGAVDLSTTDPAVLARLHAAGFAAWIRGAAQGMSPHIHAVLMNHPELSGPARAQVASFLQGGSGLGVGGGGGGGGIDVMGMLAPHIGKILLNVFRGLDPLRGIGGAVAKFFSAGSSDDDEPFANAAGRTSDGGVVGPGGVITGGDSSTDPGREAHRSKGVGSSILSTLNLASQFAGASVAKSAAQAAARAALQAGKGAAKSAASGNPMSRLLAQYVLPSIKRDHIATAFGDVTDAIGKFGSGGAGKFGSQLMKGMANKVVKSWVPDFIMKKAEAATPPSMGVAGSGSVQQWAGLAAKALQMAGLPASQLGAFLALMQAESGGNPNAVNDWDTNAARGQASQGLMQVIPSTFAAYRDKSLPNNIVDPLANMVAAANYIKSRYGGRVPGSPYALGTPGATRGTHLVGELGPELVNFAGGETVTPAKETAEILAGPQMTATTIPEPTTFTAPAEQEADGWFGELINAAIRMQEVVQQAWNSVVNAGKSSAAVITGTTNKVAQTSDAAWAEMAAEKLTAWTMMRDQVYVPAELHQGTTMPAMAEVMRSTSQLAWTDMNLQSATQWGLMRDTTFTEAELHQGTTMPEMSVTMQTASDLAWTTMNTTSTEQWTAIRDNNVVPFEEHMSATMPEAASAMQEAVSAAFTAMVETIVSQLDTAIAKIQEFIAATEAAIAAAEALAAAQAAAATAGAAGVGGGGSGDADAALAAAGAAGMVVQGPYSNSVSASAGTHSGGGAYDIASTSQSVLQALIANGFAAWIRSGPGWEGNEHIHAVYMNAPDLSPQAAWQVQDFLRGGSGLGIPSNLARGTNGAMRGWTWVGEEGPELMWMRGGEKVMPNRDSMKWMRRSVGQYAGQDVMRRLRDASDAIGDVSVRGGSSHDGCDVNVEFNFNGPVHNGEDVRRAVDEAIPKLRSALQARSGARKGG